MTRNLTLEQDWGVIGQPKAEAMAPDSLTVGALRRTRDATPASVFLGDAKPSKQARRVVFYCNLFHNMETAMGVSDVVLSRQPLKRPKPPHLIDSVT